MSKKETQYFSKKVRDIFSVVGITERLSKNIWSELNSQILSLKNEQKLIKKDLSFLLDFEQKNSEYKFKKTLQKYIAGNQSALKRTKSLIRKKKLSRISLYLFNLSVLFIQTALLGFLLAVPYGDFLINENTYLNVANDFGGYIIYEFQWFDFNSHSPKLNLFLEIAMFTIPFLGIALMYFLPKKKYNLSEKMMIRDTSLNLRFFFSKYGFSINLIFFIVLTILNGNNTRLQEAIEKTSNIQDQSNLAMSYWVKNCSSYGKQAALHPYNRSFDEGDSNYVIDFDENNLVNSLETLSKLSEWSLDRIRPNPTKNEKRKVFCLKNNSTIEAFRTAYQGGYEITGAWEDAQNSRSESAFRGRTQTRIEEVRKANTKRSRNISASIVNGSFCDDHNCK